MVNMTCVHAAVETEGAGDGDAMRGEWGGRERGRKDSSEGGSQVVSGSAGGIEVWKKADAACRDELGSKFESDGRGGCKCVPGYTKDLDNSDTAAESSKCLQGTHKACGKVYGKFVEFDGVNNCRCRRGYFFVESLGRCVAGSDLLCQETLGMGEHARFDGVHSCRCRHGYMTDATNKCIAGSTELCAAWHGLAEFDGSSTCVCLRGTLASVPAEGEAYVGHKCSVPTHGACRERLGQHGEFMSALGACGCKSGFIQAAEGEDGCVAGSNEACQYLHGERARFNGVSECVCARGSVWNTARKCVHGSASVCLGVLGNNSFFHAEAPGGAKCMCRQGFVEVGGGCVPASDAFCRANYGASTFFDGGNECTCGVGRMYLRGKCVPLSHAVCASHYKGEGAEFDGVDSCRCKAGSVLLWEQGVCVSGNNTVCQQQQGDGAAHTLKSTPYRDFYIVSILRTLTFFRMFVRSSTA
jgi:hypothetical protein